MHKLNMKKLKLVITLALVLSPGLQLFAQELSHAYALIPQPVSVQEGKGTFVLSDATVIAVPAKQAEVEKIAAYLAAKVNKATGYNLKTVESVQGKAIQFVLHASPDTRLGKEGYLLDATAAKVMIQANTPAGLFYGVQTLLQLLPKEIESKTAVKNVNWQIPAITISDYPRFAWRGIMLDVSRHFFPKEYIKDYIDQIALG